MDPPSPAAPPPTPPRGTERRLLAKMEPDEHIVSWTRGWVSREGRWHRLLAARTLDFAVLTDRHLHFYATGFFTRRPRRAVYSTPLDRLVVARRADAGGQRLRLVSTDHRPLRLELGRRDRDLAFAARLLASTRAAGTA